MLLVIWIEQLPRDRHITYLKNCGAILFTPPLHDPFHLAGRIVRTCLAEVVLIGGGGGINWLCIPDFNCCHLLNCGRSEVL